MFVLVPGYNHIGAAEGGANLEGELAAEALGVTDAAHGAHGEPQGSIPERELLELPTSATARVE